MLSLKELLAITEPKQLLTKYWVDSDGVKHSISGSVSTDVVGGFKKNPTNRGRRYFDGQAVYYKV